MGGRLPSGRDNSRFDNSILYQIEFVQSTVDPSIGISLITVDRTRLAPQRLMYLDSRREIKWMALRACEQWSMVKLSAYQGRRISSSIPVPRKNFLLGKQLPQEFTRLFGCIGCALHGKLWVPSWQSSHGQCVHKVNKVCKSVGA